MSDQPYMNGRGLRSRTRELCNRTWDTAIGAWLGISAAVSAAIIGPLLMYAMPRYPQVDPSIEMQLLGWAIILAVIIGGAYASLPYWRACAELKDHRQKIAMETEKRGSGWARD